MEILLLRNLAVCTDAAMLPYLTLASHKHKVRPPLFFSYAYCHHIKTLPWSGLQRETQSKILAVLFAHVHVELVEYFFSGVLRELSSNAT